MCLLQLDLCGPDSSRCRRACRPLACERGRRVGDAGIHSAARLRRGSTLGPQPPSSRLSARRRRSRSALASCVASMRFEAGFVYPACKPCYPLPLERRKLVKPDANVLRRRGALGERPDAVGDYLCPSCGRKSGFGLSAEGRRRPRARAQSRDLDENRSRGRRALWTNGDEAAVAERLGAVGPRRGCDPDESESSKRGRKTPGRGGPRLADRGCGKRNDVCGHEYLLLPKRGGYGRKRLVDAPAGIVEFRVREADPG